MKLTFQKMKTEHWSKQFSTKAVDRCSVPAVFAWGEDRHRYDKGVFRLSPFNCRHGEQPSISSIIFFVQISL